MKLMKYGLIVTLLSATSISFADITITNNTDSYGTGKFNIGYCSSTSSKGILAPHGTISVPSYLFKFCGSKGCEAHIFMDQTCTHEVATVYVSQAGVQDIQNLDPSEFIFSGGGNNVTADPVKKVRHFLDWLL